MGSSTSRISLGRPRVVTPRMEERRLHMRGDEAGYILVGGPAFTLEEAAKFIGITGHLVLLASSVSVTTLL